MESNPLKYLNQSIFDLDDQNLDSSDQVSDSQMKLGQSYHSLPRGPFKLEYAPYSEKLIKRLIREAHRLNKDD
jgi:hypothetical protein